jgi:hypothetical protein
MSQLRLEPAGSAVKSSNDDPYTYQSLRKMGIGLSILSHRNLTFTHRIFRDITHLNFEWFMPNLPWTTFAGLSALTHLNFDAVACLESSLGLERSVSLILDNSPPSLHVLIFPCIGPRYSKRDLRMDPIYNLLIFPELPFEMWDSYSPGVGQHSSIAPQELHLMWRILLGHWDTRIVVRSRLYLPHDHILKDEIITPVHTFTALIPTKTHWSIAEQIIETRRRRLASGDVTPQK